MLKRALLIPFGLFVGVLMVELLLQVLAVVVQSSVGAGLQASWMTGSVRVLCLGDSNTYGLYLKPDQAYPPQLEAHWNEGGESPQLEVMNLGIPGMNSSSLLKDYRSRLETFEPDIVVVMVGANDFWTLPLPLSEADPAGSWLNTLRRRSKLYRYFYMVRRGEAAPEIEVTRVRRDQKGSEHEVSYGDEVFTVEWNRGHRGNADTNARALAKNLSSLVEHSREAGVELYLMTYPSQLGHYSQANEVIRQLSAGDPSEARVIDLAGTFEAVCETDSCPDLLFEDGHPNATGYELVSRTLAERIERDRPFP